MNSSATAKFISFFDSKKQPPAVIFLRKVLLAIFFTAIVSGSGTLVLWPNGTALAWFAFFALLSGWNFWGLSKFVSRVIPGGWSRGLGMQTFLGVQLRLFLTGFFVYGAVVWWNVPVAALLCGLSAALFWGAVFGLFNAFSASS